MMRLPITGGFVGSHAYRLAHGATVLGSGRCRRRMENIAHATPDDAGDPNQFFPRLDTIARGIPCEIYTFTALLPWQLSAHCVPRAGNSVVNSQGLISKVYLPRLIVPMGTMGSSLVDFLVSSVVLIAMMFWYGLVPGPA